MVRFSSLGSALRRFSNQESGGVAVMAAVAAIALCGISALAIDFGNALRVRTKVQAGADAAALAAATTAQTYLMTHSAQSSSDLGAATQLASTAATTYFKDNALERGAPRVSTKVKLSIAKGLVTAEVDYSTNVPMALGAIVGFKTFPVGGTSIATSKLPSYVEVYLLIDVSGSMALGASKAEQDLIQSQLGCAFACHDGVAVRGYSDAYTWAVANNILLRYGAINQGILALMNTIDQSDPGHQFIKTQVYSFADNLTLNTALTTDTRRVRSNLPTAPVTSSMTAGGTHFKEHIDQVVSDIGKGGTGQSPSDPVKLLIIATDGVQDPGRAWVNDVSLRASVAPFDMSSCEDLKKKGVTVGIIHTPYQEIPTDWGYNATLGQPSQIGGPGTRADDVPTVLKKCGGAQYVEASDTQKIVSSFVSIFRSLGASRLTQ